MQRSTFEPNLKEKFNGYKNSKLNQKAKNVRMISCLQELKWTPILSFIF